MIDPLPWTDAFEVCLRVAVGDHRLKFGGVFAEIVPQRGERGSFRRAPHLGKPAGQSRGGAKVFLEVVRRSIALTTVGDRSAGHGHCEGANQDCVLISFSLDKR